MDKKYISPAPGKRILGLRKQTGLSRAEFEAVAGVSASTLRYMETGKREVSILQARLLSTIFIYRFGFEEGEASEDFLLYGKRNNDSGKKLGHKLALKISALTYSPTAHLDNA